MLRPTILLAEDDCGLAFALMDFFEANGLIVIPVADGGEVVAQYRKVKSDLLLLDVQLPHKSGLEIMEEIRTDDRLTPIIIMTGSEFSEEKQVKGYELGAVNYLQKPILPQAVLAQIKNILSMPMGMKCYRIGKLEIVKQNQQLVINGRETLLLDKEARVLEFLLDHYGETIDRGHLMQVAWGDNRYELNNTLNGIVYHLRYLLSSYPLLKIRTVYGEGYKIGVPIASTPCLK